MATRLPSLLRPPIAFAHRGARAHAPENTLEAFHLALRLGATGLESDVWLTADGHAVLDHGGTVGGRIRRSPIARHERARLPDHLCTLPELYQACGTGFHLSVDIKEPAAIDAVVAAATDAGGEALDQLWLCHPDLALLTQWRARWPELRLVHSTRLERLSRSTEHHGAELAEIGIQAVNLHHRDWTGGHIALYHRFDRLAFAWDLQFERVLEEALDAGIDAVYSDHVDLMVAAVDAVA
jgi:glycerophosphoryl diester phosphodiesterase